MDEFADEEETDGALTVRDIFALESSCATAPVDVADDDEDWTVLDKSLLVDAIAQLGR